MSIKSNILALVVLIITSPLTLSDDLQDQLFDAVQSNNADECLKLIKEGANLNVRNQDGLTPLMVASNLGFDAIASYLIEGNVDGNAAEINAVTDETKMTALHFAAEKGHLYITQILVDFGADISLENSRGRTAYQLSRINRHSEVAAYLREHEVSQNPNRGRVDSRREDNKRSDYRVLVDAVLADANSITQSLTQYKDVVEAIEILKKSGYSESRAWMSKRATSYKSVMTSLDRQIKAECALVKTYATEEDAGEVVSLLDQTTKAWTDKFTYINEEMKRVRREQRREAMNQQREQRSRRPRDDEESRAQDNENEESQPEYDISKWLETDMNGSEDLCTSVHDELMESYGQMMDLAVKENAQKTLVATQAVVLDRSQRFTAIMNSFEIQEEGNSRLDRGLRREREDARDDNSRGRRQEPRR